MTRARLGAAACLLIAAAASSSAGAGEAIRWLDTLNLAAMRQGWAAPRARLSVQGRPITVAGRRFARGIGTHAASAWTLELSGAPARLVAWVGVDDEMAGHSASVEFVVTGGGRTLWRSGTMRLGDPARRVDVRVDGVRLLRLLVTDAGDGIDSDHADWGDAAIVGPGAAAVAPRAALGIAVLDPAIVRPDWGAARFDRAADGGPLRAGGRSFGEGVGMRAGADVLFTALGRRYARFEASAAVDGPGAARLRVLVDGRERFRSSVLRAGDAPIPVAVSLAGAGELRLVVDRVGSGEPPRAAWGDGRLVAAPHVPAEAPARAVRVVRGGGLEALIGADGALVGLRSPRLGGRLGVRGATRLAGCVAGPARLRAVPGGGVESERGVLDPVTGARCRLRERFLSTRSSVRWEVEVRGAGRPWSTPIETALRWPDAAKARFWTAWADPRPARAPGWADPLTVARFAPRLLWYGAAHERPLSPVDGYSLDPTDIFSLPIATVLYAARGGAVSVVQSPDDRLLDVKVATDAAGMVCLSRSNHRIEAGRPVRFAIDLTAHPPDPRAALGWLVRRYPRSFEPAVPAARDMAGCGAYSSWQGELDLRKLRRMAFRVNWQASFEFPYMGMFLPPVGPEQEWTSFRREATSQGRLNAYYARMASLGFHVLAYFNVTEFGAGIQAAPPPGRAALDADLWRDPNGFLWWRLEGAVLRDAAGRPIGSWEGAVAMDPGEPAYRDFLVEQARRHLERTPAMAGICIDRTDWTRYHNLRRDDGVSWVNGGPARSLQVSWDEVMGRIGPSMHRAGKVVFLNTLVRRLDLMRQADGIYDEFGMYPGALNAAALLGLRKSVIAWTSSPDDLRPAPDGFFQRYLHLGVFPTAPFPGNDHSIRPDAWADAQYLAYGPLLECLRGREWVLEPNAARAAPALANLFRVPEGYVAPITFGGAARQATLRLRRLAGLERGGLICEALLPDEAGWRRVPWRREAAGLRLRVPLARGCAMVRVRAAARSSGG
ncbi:MAG: NPCBM/NEW2 domain-containing protein [Chthonomonadales bacterium]|nr:NPCBM/NEW2 domain-containing protein [Chthonomonadales bacterium]